VRLRRLTARGFRNLADFERDLPPSGFVLLGANAQGKTSLLEAIYYPVLYRSFRGAPDQEIARFDGPGFLLEAGIEGGPAGSVGASWTAGGKRKRITIDGEDRGRVADAVGAWLAVSFLPEDVELATGPGATRRGYLDRLLSLADPRYLRALARYRAALAQRNSALRQGRPELAQAFDQPLSAAGSVIVAARERWAGDAAGRFVAEFDGLGEGTGTRLSYRGCPALREPAAWPGVLAEAWPRDLARGMTTVGPHRDDLVLELAGRPLREYGSNGQQRAAAVALKLIELASLRAARGTEPALLLDDVFAAFDGDRQRRLAGRLLGEAERQVFLTAPRPDELPPGLGLPVWRMERGVVTV
jgi:DNA replication and repair protein RecF